MKKNIENSAAATSRPVRFTPRTVRSRKMPGNGTSGARLARSIVVIDTDGTLAHTELGPIDTVAELQTLVAEHLGVQL